MGKPVLPDLETLIQAGINPKTGLPLKFGNKRCTTKEDIKRVIRKNDEQIAVNKYVWYNLPMNLTSQELERMLYYKGQLCFFYLKDLDKFFFMPYALDGTIDFYGRYNTIHPVPMTSGTTDKGNKAQAEYLESVKLNCVYGVYVPKEHIVIEETGEVVPFIPKELFEHSAVLLHDYCKQLSQTIIPTQQMNDPIIDLEAECMPFLRTALLNATGVKGVRVADQDSANEVFEGSKQLQQAAIAAEPYVPIIGAIDFQELTDGTLGKSAEFLQSMQAIDNFRLGLHGVPNGGLFDKQQYVNNAQTELNMGGADVSLTMMDGLLIRQNFANIVNSIWGLGIWCEPSETIINMDLNGDGKAYDSDEGDQSGMEDNKDEQ